MVLEGQEKFSDQLSTKVKCHRVFIQKTRPKIVYFLNYSNTLKIKYYCY